MADRPGVPAAPSLICVGNLTVDEVVSPDGVTTTSVGGDALFAALAARLLGGRPQVLAPIGTDAPDDLHAALLLAGTEIGSLPRRPYVTVRNRVAYGVDGSRSWTLVTGDEHFEAMSVQPADVPASALAAGGILLSAMALRAQLRLAAWLRPRTSAVLYFDPQEDYIAGHEVELRNAVRRCDVFLPSEVEAVALAGTDDVHRAARSFLALGPRLVVVKLAERGCLLAWPDGQVEIPATGPGTVVDSTGAGDAFCGAFAAVHLITDDPIRAARAGARAATAAIACPGLSGLVAAVRSGVGEFGVGGIACGGLGDAVPRPVPMGGC